MEEADDLATRAAVISRRVPAPGHNQRPAQEVRRILSRALVLKSAPVSTRAEMELVRQWVVRTFDCVKFDMYSSSHGQIKFSVPASTAIVKSKEPVQEDEITIDGGDSHPPTRSNSVGMLFSYLEASKDEIGLKFYSVGATLDNVFLNVVRENNVMEEDTLPQCRMGREDISFVFHAVRSIGWTEKELN